MEFNLSEKQLITITKIIDAIAKKGYNKIGYLLVKIRENDKEFIKKLKENDITFIQHIQSHLDKNERGLKLYKLPVGMVGCAICGRTADDITGKQTKINKLAGKELI